MVADVVMVSVEFCVDALVRFSEVELKLEARQVMGVVAPVGTVVTVQVRLTVPVKELTEVPVIVEVLPELTPCTTVMPAIGALLRVKVGRRTATLTGVDCRNAA